MTVKTHKLFPVVDYHAQSRTAQTLHSVSSTGLHTMNNVVVHTVNSIVLNLMDNVVHL